MKHTDLPWTTDEETGNETILGANGILVADCCINVFKPHRTTAENQANAIFIVRACNCHEELLEAAKELLRSFDDVGICCHGVLKTEKLAAAIAKVGEGRP